MATKKKTEKKAAPVHEAREARETRGEWRGVYTVLVESPEFKRLTKDGKLLFWGLKMSLGASGIGKLYDDEIAERAGLVDGELAAARAELIAARWLEVEGRIHWLRNGLRFDPSIWPRTNANHRRSIVRFLAGLPRLPIVQRMAAYYGLPDPFAAGAVDTIPDTIPDGIPDAIPHTIEIPSPMGSPAGMASPIPSPMVSPMGSPIRRKEKGDSRNEKGESENTGASLSETLGDFAARSPDRELTRNGGTADGEEPAAAPPDDPPNVPPYVPGPAAPAAWEPSREHRRRAVALHLDVATEARLWALQRRARGIHPADPDADFALWLERSKGGVHGPGRDIRDGPSANSGPLRAIPAPYVEPPGRPATPEERKAGMAAVRAACEAPRTVLAPEPPAPADDDRPTTPEERAAGMALIRAAVAGVTLPSDSPADRNAAARENRERQLAEVRKRLLDRRLAEGASDNGHLQ